MLKNLMRFIPGIFALLLLVVEVALNLFGTKIIIALWLAVILLIIQVGVFYFELESIKNIRPLIEPYGLPFPDIRSLKQIKEDNSQVASQPIFFNIRISNNPKMRLGQATARKVFAQLTLFDEAKGKLVGPIFGRWGDTEQPGARSLFVSNRDLLSVDLESGGLPRELNLAMKYPQESEI